MSTLNEYREALSRIVEAALLCQFGDRRSCDKFDAELESAKALLARGEPDKSDLHKKLRQLCILSETYWSQADSESYVQNKRSDETDNKRVALMDEIVALLARPEQDLPAWHESAAKALLSRPETEHDLTDGEPVLVAYDDARGPSGIRDRRGFICHFYAVPHWAGQDERFQRELAQRKRQAEVMLRALKDFEPAAAENPQPFCWVIPGDNNENVNGFIDARVDCRGEFTKPLYALPAAAEKTLPFDPSLIHALRTPGCDSCDQICFAAADAIEALCRHEPAAAEKSREPLELLEEADKFIQGFAGSTEAGFARKARADRWRRRYSEYISSIPLHSPPAATGETK